MKVQERGLREIVFTYSSPNILGFGLQAQDGFCTGEGASDS
jgi:hypothetical protein